MPLRRSSYRAAGPPALRAGGQRGLLPCGHSAGRPLSPGSAPTPSGNGTDTPGTPGPASSARGCAAPLPGSARGGTSSRRSSRSPGRDRPSSRGGFAHRARLRGLRNKEAADWLAPRCERSDWLRGRGGDVSVDHVRAAARRSGRVPFAMQKIAA